LFARPLPDYYRFSGRRYRDSPHFRVSGCDDLRVGLNALK
jgi:hypothetical protein